MRTRRSEFTDRQKAEIFVRDRALCCYTGKSLWLIDYGGGPAMPPWIEHITPAFKGGAATLENGVLACWYHNHIQSDRGEPILLFQDGLPNWLAFEIFEQIPEHFDLHFELCGTTLVGLVHQPSCVSSPPSCRSGDPANE